MLSKVTYEEEKILKIDELLNTALKLVSEDGSIQSRRASAMLESACTILQKEGTRDTG